MIFFKSLLLILPVFQTVTGECDTAGQSECTTFITFNTGLTPRIEHYENRSASIPQALLDQDADVVCLQEYWFEKDIEKLTSTVHETYPYHFSPIHKEVGVLADAKGPFATPKSACSMTDLGFFQTRVLPCALMNGCVAKFSEATDVGLECLAQNCSEALKDTSFSADCFSCTTMSASGMSDLFDWCQPQATGPDNRFNAPGLVLLSKRPLSNAQYNSYEPNYRTTLQRGYIQAEVKNLGLILCTHMSAVFGTYYEYNLPYQSYVEQQRHEVKTLKNNFGGQDHLLAGDFNMGPTVVSSDEEKNLSGEAPSTFSSFLENGYNTTYLEDDGRCTYCGASNELSEGYNNVIDFVLFKGTDYSYHCAERVLDQTSPYPLSDHFGIKTTICK